ncbi:MAG: hypothetical protein WD100_05040, partial [Tistlia sp.]
SIVLTDYVAMEAYKADTLTSICRRMTIPCQYPAQVMVLRSTRDACGLALRADDFAEQIIDPEQSAGFGRFCQALALAESGNQKIRQRVLEHGREAREHLERMLCESDGMMSAITEMAAGFSSQELKAIRRPDAAYSDALVSKLARNIIALSLNLMNSHPDVKKEAPSFQGATDRFIFRIAICGLVLATRWIAVGGVQGVRPEKIRNDQVDINFAAFATYYDGLFTADKKLTELYRESKAWLNIFGEANPA